MARRGTRCRRRCHRPVAHACITHCEATYVFPLPRVNIGDTCEQGVGGVTGTRWRQPPRDT